ncbi:acetyltransferase [Streptomyces sp. AcH 505]|uniref:GNAT family N-acetyltransferase n=1 Tax=unclassified Streptomyces TaxID=2593676 RepID=UPI000591F4FA|nr:GNAT family N-acetyltransferase [Streptomyces sp. NBC_00370]KIF69634.1 acetyltransferase [Streptomyces sp. AcH 505]
MEPLTLTSPRLLLRTLTPDDVDAVHTICQDPEIQRWVTIPSPYERQHAQYFVEQLVPDGWQTGTMCTFGVFPIGGGPLMGAVNAHSQSGIWETGYWTAKEYRGRGFTTEAVTAVARWVFTALAAERLEWRAEVGNTGSRAVAEKAGFVMEGVLRAALLNRGTLRDVRIGSLLPSDLGLPGPHPYLPSDAA